MQRPAAADESDRIATLWRRVHEVRAGDRLSPRTHKLLAGGAGKMAQKLIEEAAETGIEAVRGDRTAVLNESVDLTTTSSPCGPRRGSPRTISGPRWTAATACSAWPRSCRKAGASR